MEQKLSRFPLISPPRAVLAGVLVLLAIALPADIEYDWQAGAVEYLSEIGFGVEYGSGAPVLHKWAQDVMIEVHGSPTKADLQTLEQ